jgi:hypothetical protein
MYLQRIVKRLDRSLGRCRILNLMLLAETHTEQETWQHDAVHSVTKYQHLWEILASMLRNKIEAGIPPKHQYSSGPVALLQTASCITTDWQVSVQILRRTQCDCGLPRNWECTSVFLKKNTFGKRWLIINKQKDFRGLNKYGRMKHAISCNITQCMVLIPYRSFGTTDRSRNPRWKYLTPEDGTDRLFRNVGKKLPLYAT